MRNWRTQPVRPGEPPADRLYRLSGASRRINQSLDFDTVLQDAVDSSSDLTGARYGAITVPGEKRELSGFIVSGLTEEEPPGYGKCPRGWASSSTSAQFLRADGDKIIVMVESQENQDKQGTLRPPQPVRKLGYSGHTAWGMAIMSELAYMRFEEEDLDTLLALPDELAKAVGRSNTDSEAQVLERLLATRDKRDLRLLRAVLEAGGFELVGALSDPGTGTQGFVALRRAGDDMDMAVVSFRGTANVRHWKTNLRYSLTPVDFPHPAANEPPAKVHRGFRDAFMSVRYQVDRYLPPAEGLPIFLTGHSLGGSLATLGAAHLSGWGVAVCYTFGGPCVGNSGFSRSLRTPVYRVVNPLSKGGT